MDFTRRRFVSGLGAFAVAGRAGLLKAADAFDGCKPELTVGILSDVHIAMRADGKGFDGLSTFKRTLEWFRDQGVDAVQISGDISDHGLVEEFRAVADAWNATFPDGRAPDGRRVEKLFVYGNHDWEGFAYGGFAKKHFGAEYRTHTMRSDYAGNWKRIFGEDYSPVWRKEVRGYTFIGAHWIADTCRGADECGCPQAHGWFAENAKTIDPSRPFFYLQHPHPKNTCYGPWAWGRDDGRLTAALSEFPNAVAFSGHSHYTLADDRSVWQGAFTSIGAGSLRYAAAEYGVEPYGYENDYSTLPSWREHSSLKVMPKVPAGERYAAPQGMVMRVYGDSLAFRRVECMNFTRMGEDWSIPFPFADPKPFDFSNRAKTLPVPQFAADVQIVVEKTTGKTRSGKEVDVYEMAIPPALAVAGARAFDYAVRAIGADGSVVERRVLASGYCHAPGSKYALRPTVCRLNAEVLPQAKPLRFEVFPVNCMGRRGRGVETVRIT